MKVPRTQTYILCVSNEFLLVSVASGVKSYLGQLRKLVDQEVREPAAVKLFSSGQCGALLCSALKFRVVQSNVLHCNVVK